MNERETTQILMLINGYDARTYADGEAARVRVKAWTIGLADADPTEAARFVTRYYKNADNRYPIQIGDIATACKPNPKWADRDEHVALAGRPMPPIVRDILNRNPLAKAARRIPCTWVACKAPAGSPCNLPSGAMHPSRLDAAAVTA